MNDETRELLLECKKAGYEFIAIGVVDKRVPISKQIEKFGERKYSRNPSGGAYWGGIERDGVMVIKPKVVCAAPNQRDAGRPAIWNICEKSDLTAGMEYRGQGCGESHSIRATHNLDLGCYDLSQIN